MQRFSLFALAVAGLLAACTQPLDLGPVQAEQARSVKRDDSFQAAASNGRVLVAATASGALVRSADAGKTWTRQQLATPASVIALAACPDGRFVGVDFYRKVWIGDAEGAAWSARPLDKSVDPMAVSCDPAGRLWVVGSHSTVMSSRDGGQTWTPQDFGEDAILTTVQFLDAQRGVITGEFGTVLSTADGGKTWTPQPPMPGDFYPYSTVFLDARRGWSSGIGGVLLKTTDGGQTWAPQDNPSAAPMYSLLRQGEGLYGLGAGGQMIVLKGERWERFDHGLAVPAYLAAGAVLDAGSLLVVGAAGALHVVNAPGKLALAAAVAPETPR